MHWELRGTRYHVNESGKRTTYTGAINRTRSLILSAVELPFPVIKRQWRFTTARYCGLAENRARVYARGALANLIRRLRAAAGPCSGPLEGDWRRRTRRSTGTFQAAAVA
jgi:hypothetical protein